ncbi:MAG: hypothetical protein LBB26_03545 [Puniceicoccales bacterium]|jgi:hypothetical protein|nr:hypothetical protein [Puniceicoccales bacterium]
MNGVGVGDFTSVKFDTLAAVEAGGGKGTVEKSPMPTVQDAMREAATCNPYEPNEDATGIANSLILNSAYVPIFPPIDLVSFDDEDDKTVEAPKEHTPAAPVEGNFGESAAVAPQGASAGAEIRPSSGGTDGGLVIDAESFFDEPPEGLALTSREVIDTIDRHLAREDITEDMRSALELMRDGFERAMEALQGEAGQDFGANERAIDAMEKARDAAMAAGETAIDARELDIDGEIREFAEALKNFTPDGASKAILGVMMSIFALLDLRDTPELRGPTWQGGLAHAVLDPATPAYAKKKATRILNMAQRYKEIMKQREARMEDQEKQTDQPKDGQSTWTSKQKVPGEIRTSSSEKKDEKASVNERGEVRGSTDSSDSEENSDST